MSVLLLRFWAVRAFPVAEWCRQNVWRAWPPLRTFSAAEAFDVPYSFDTGFWWEKFVDGALPFGANFVAIVASAVDALFGKFGRRHGRIFGKLTIFLEQGSKFAFDFLFAFGIEDFFFGEKFLVEQDGIAFLPKFPLASGNVFGRVMLSMAAAAERFRFDENRAFTGAGSIHGLFGGGIDGYGVIAIDDVAVDAIGFGAVRQIFDRDLAAHGSGVGPEIIFEDEDEGSFLRSGEIESFVKNACGAAAITNPGHGHNFLAEITPGHGNASHDRDEIAKHRDGRDDVQSFEIPEMASAVFALGGRSEFSHMLSKNVARRNTFDEERADIANHGRHPVLLFECVSAANGDGFLTEAGVEAADNFVLAEEAGHGVFDLAIEAHVVVEVEILLAGKFQNLRAGEFSSRHGWSFSE